MVSNLSTKQPLCTTLILNKFCTLVTKMSISYAPSPPLYLKLWAMHSQNTVGIIGSKNVISPTGNRTPVSRVTGGDTYHYTIEDNCAWLSKLGRITYVSGNS